MSDNKTKTALDFINYDELEKEAVCDLDEEVTVDAMVEYIFASDK